MSKRIFTEIQANSPFSEIRMIGSIESNGSEVFEKNTKSENKKTFLPNLNESQRNDVIKAIWEIQEWSANKKLQIPFLDANI